MPVTVTQVSVVGASASRISTLYGPASAARQETRRRVRYQAPSSPCVTKPVVRTVRPFSDRPLSWTARDENSPRVSSTGSAFGSAGNVPTPRAAYSAASRSARPPGRGRRRRARRRRARDRRARRRAARARQAARRRERPRAARHSAAPRRPVARRRPAASRHPPASRRPVVLRASAVSRRCSVSRRSPVLPLPRSPHEEAGERGCGAARNRHRGGCAGAGPRVVVPGAVWWPRPVR